MGSITTRTRKDGTVVFFAQVTIGAGSKATHREGRTFERRPAAAAWIAKREKELRAPGGLEAATTVDPPLGDVIERYTKTSLREIGRTKAQVLRSILGYHIATLPCSKITSADIVAFAEELSQGRKPQTVANYLSHLGAIFAIARPAWGYPLDRQAMKDAFAVTKRLGTTRKSAQRERRPTLGELDSLMEHFGEVARRRPSSVPMQRVIAFALFSTRRLEEITRIRWADLDEAGSRILVRDMKNPGEKLGNNVWCDLPPPALAIVQAMPRVSEAIFPFSTDAITAAFTRACKFLGIEDLHFHDLRHEGVSRLFETGLSIPHVAAVSGHRSWTSLRRYTHLRQAGDKYAGWPWLARIQGE